MLGTQGSADLLCRSAAFGRALWSPDAAGRIQYRRLCGRLLDSYATVKTRSEGSADLLSRSAATRLAFASVLFPNSGSVRLAACRVCAALIFYHRCFFVTVALLKSRRRLQDPDFERLALARDYLPTLPPHDFAGLSGGESEFHDGGHVRLGEAGWSPRLERLLEAGVRFRFLVAATRTRCATCSLAC